MADWNELLKESIGTPEVPGGRGRKKTKRPPISDEQCVKNTIEWVGKQTQSHTLQRKATAPERVMEKAMQYHARETSRRMAKYSSPKPDRRGMMFTIVFMVSVCSVLACVLQAYIP